MVEYLTLGQLEDIWRKQDAYTDYVDMPQRTVELIPTIPSTQHTSPSQGVYQNPTKKVSGLSNTTKPSIVNMRKILLESAMSVYYPPLVEFLRFRALLGYFASTVMVCSMEWL
ncbi:MAG: hypothetical protein FRX48_08750 [Lasallia pustulata]|uniref:Uncharacterized protein n=1 Tax=Lasallia pustulata TaxID=136370 RepID=A0A5M8PDU4_9LECA|nr:MAG: hypothetical protein FRX48_08750 [Lasallia pustulata]